MTFEIAAIIVLALMIVWHVLLMNRLAKATTAFATVQAEINKATRGVMETQHKGLVEHRDRLDTITTTNDDLVDCVNQQQSNLDGMAAAVERMSEITEAAVDAAAASQKFYEVLMARDRVPEHELAEMSKALAKWVHAGRLQ